MVSDSASTRFYVGDIEVIRTNQDSIDERFGTLQLSLDGVCMFEDLCIVELWVKTKPRWSYWFP